MNMLTKKNVILISVSLILLGIAGVIVAVKFLTEPAKVEKKKTDENVIDVPHTEVKENAPDNIV